eukprot:UN00880
MLVILLSFFVIGIYGAPTPNCGKMSMIKVGDNSYACTPLACDYDMCDPGLGKCNNSYAVIDSQCEYSESGNYSGVASFPYGVSTEYCTLSNGQGCEGGACGNHISTALLSQYGVTGIAAVNPWLFGLDENRNKASWGQGCTTNSKICYYLDGPGGSANIMITDRCAGYCTIDLKTLLCDPNGQGAADCGQCVLSYYDPTKIHPNCPCIGTDGDMYPTCCGNDPSCGTPLNAQCDWCAGNNHAHFDLDYGTFNRVCGSQAYKGHCVLKQFVPYKCG